MKNLISSYWEMAKGQHGQCVLLVALLALSGLSEGGALLALQPVLQGSLGMAGAGPWLHLLALGGLPPESSTLVALFLFCFMGVGTAVLHYATESMLVRMTVTVEAYSRETISLALLNSQWSSFLALRLGAVGDTILMDGTQMGRGLTLFVSALGAALTVMGLLASSFLLSAQMTIYTLIFALAGYLIFRWVTAKAQRHAQQQKDVLTNINELICDIFNNLKFFRSTGKRDVAERSVIWTFGAYAQAYFKASHYNILMRGGLEGAGVLGIFAFLCTSISLGSKDIASTLIFLAIFYRIVPRLLTLQQSLYNAEMCLPWYNSWRTTLSSLRNSSSMPGGLTPPSFERTLELKDVCYRYHPSSRDALNGIDLTLAKGKFVALVGRSGSGKSTLMDLVTGLLVPSSGEILLDGLNLQLVEQETWRRHIGLVLQESPIFHGTVLDNITWGEDTPDRAWASQVLNQVGAWEFVAQMHGGLDAPVGEKGGKLSGGQRQRLALARALYRRPWLLILDEPTSALDAASEQCILEVLSDIKGSCSTLLISHRLAPVRIADEVIVFAEGSIVEHGTWGELIAKPGGTLAEMARQDNSAPWLDKTLRQDGHQAECPAVSPDDTNPDWQAG